MSAYDNNPRVHPLGPVGRTSTGTDHYFVTADDGTEYEVYQWEPNVDWVIAQDGTAVGQFPTADEAIRSLIGDPA